MGEIGGVGEGKQEVVDVSDASDKADVSSDAPKQADPFDPREDKQQQSLMSKGDKQGSQTRTKQGDTAPAPGDAENPQGSPEDSQQDTFPDGSHQDGSPESSQQDAFPDGSHQNESQSEAHDTQGEYGDPFDPRNDHPLAQPDAIRESLQLNDSQSQIYTRQGEYRDPFDPRNDQPLAQPDANVETSQQNDGQTRVYDAQGKYRDPFDPRNDHPQEQSNANAHEANGEQQTVTGDQAGGDDSFHPSGDASDKTNRVNDASTQKLEDVEHVLSTIPRGNEALNIQEKYDVNVAIEGQEGSFYDPSTNSVTLDSRLSTEEAATVYVHEMNHAEYYNEGKSADVNRLSRNEYVDNMIEEESEGTVKQIEANLELGDNKVDASGTPLQDQYSEAYKNQVDIAKAINPNISQQELHDMGRDAGKQRVIEGFNNREVVTSTTGDSYPDFYGQYWDEVHQRQH